MYKQLLLAFVNKLRILVLNNKTSSVLFGKHLQTKEVKEYMEHDHDHQAEQCECDGQLGD